MLRSLAYPLAQSHFQRYPQFGMLSLQGDIESYAAMSPKDLTDRFEHISGSETYRKQYHELEAQKLKAEEQTSFLFSKRKGVTQEKKQKKEQKEEAEKHVKMQEELVGRLLSMLQSQLSGT